MPVTFDPPGSTTLKKRRHSVKDITTWAQEHFRKPSLNTVCCDIYTCKLKFYNAKQKPYINNIQKWRRLFWAQAHLRWTDAKWKSVLLSEESTIQIVFGNHGRCVVRAKEEKDHTDCYQCSYPLKIYGTLCSAKYDSRGPGLLSN